MDEELDYTELISEVLSGKSISRSLFDLGYGATLRKYILGKSGVNRLERFVYRYNDALHYLELRSAWRSITERFNVKIRSLYRRIELLNLLLVLIISSLNPFLNLLLTIRGIISTEIIGLDISELLHGGSEFDMALNVYGVLQIILTTYLLSHTEYFEKRVLRKLIIYILIYYLVSNLFRAFTALVLT